MGLTEKTRTSSFLVIELKYSSIFFINHISKDNKNSDLTIKNSSLYKVELTVALPKNHSKSLRE